MNYGFGCAMVVDGKDRICVTSRSANPCVAIFDSAGKLLETWTKDIHGAGSGYRPEAVAATAHGLYWCKEGDNEYLYWTENVAAPKGKPKIGARVYKTDLNGKILYTIGNVDKEIETSQKFDFTNPTDVAVAANGDIYVVDGYGSQLVHRFDKNFKLIKTMGGRGKEHGKFNTCHGIWVNTLKKEPGDLHRRPGQRPGRGLLDLDLEYKRTIAGRAEPVLLLPARRPALRPGTGRPRDDPRRGRQGRRPPRRRAARGQEGQTRPSTRRCSPSRTP